MQLLKSIVLGCIIFLGSVSLTQSQNFYTNEDGVAIKGYDVVSYHTTHEAVKGKKKHATDYQGATFYFTSEAHKEAFEKHPDRYLPEFGGYCAYAVGAKNKKVPADPETFKFRDGELYLFFNGVMNDKKMNTLLPWIKNEEDLAAQAHRNWSEMK